MKKSDITYQDKLNELRLDISHPNSQGINFIFVEGEADIRLFRKFFNLDKCKVENIPGGNVKVEQCVETLVKIYPLIIGIRDSDFIQLSGESYNIPNMFLTDFHDIEITMLNHEPIVSAIVIEYSGISKHKHIEFKNQIINSISLVGYLKWLNNLERLELNFSSSFQDLISFVNQTIDIQQYIKRVLSRSPNAKEKSEAIISQKVNDLKLKEPDLLQLTNGHDLLNAFAKYFREVEGRSDISGQGLETALRMLSDMKTFESTTLFSSLVEWQSENSTQLFDDLL